MVTLRVSQPNKRLCIHFSAGIALIHSKLYTEALDIFKQLVADYPDNPSYSKQVSILESSLGQEQL